MFGNYNNSLSPTPAAKLKEGRSIKIIVFLKFLIYKIGYLCVDFLNIKEKYKIIGLVET